MDKESVEMFGKFISEEFSDIFLTQRIVELIDRSPNFLSYDKETSIKDTKEKYEEYKKWGKDKIKEVYHNNNWIKINKLKKKIQSKEKIEEKDLDFIRKTILPIFQDEIFVLQNFLQYLTYLEDICNNEIFQHSEKFLEKNKDAKYINYEAVPEKIWTNKRILSILIEDANSILFALNSLIDGFEKIQKN